MGISTQNSRLRIPSSLGPYPSTSEGGSTQPAATQIVIKTPSLSTSQAVELEDAVSQSAGQLPTVEKLKSHVETAAADGAPFQKLEIVDQTRSNSIKRIPYSENCNGHDAVVSMDPPADPFGRSNSFIRPAGLRSPLRSCTSHLSNRTEPPPLLDLAALRTVPVELTERQARKQKFEHFNKICSEITEYLFLASDAVAQNREMLEEVGITHVLNCAGGDCADHFPRQFEYRTLFLTDHVYEDISCYFHDVIDFVDSARSSHGKVLVHCHQGVSRSSTMVIAYLMWTTLKTYDEVYDMVKLRRGICNPNPGFVCQLLQWRKRFIDPTHPSPRLYCISPVHIAPGSLTLVNGLRHFPSPTAVSYSCKEVSDSDWPSTLDTRGCFLLLAPSSFTTYVWRGTCCPQPLVDYAIVTVFPRLQRYEHAPSTLALVAQGEEPSEFWAALGGPLPVPSTNPLYCPPPTPKQSPFPRSLSLTATTTLSPRHPLEHPLATASPTTLALSLDSVPPVPEDRARSLPTGSAGPIPRTQSFSSTQSKPFISRLPLAVSSFPSRNSTASSSKSMDTSSTGPAQSADPNAGSPESPAGSSESSLGRQAVGTAPAVATSQGRGGPTPSQLARLNGEREREREREVLLKRRLGGGDPRLYEWPSWEQLAMFDSDDLCDSGVYCLYSGHSDSDSAKVAAPSVRVWIGREFSVPGCGEDEEQGGAGEVARLKFGQEVGGQLLGRMALLRDVNGQVKERVTVFVELQGKEEPEFWDSFENG